MARTDRRKSTDWRKGRKAIKRAGNKAIRQAARRGQYDLPAKSNTVREAVFNF